jgi:hypothetical protein
MHGNRHTLDDRLLVHSSVPLNVDKSDIKGTDTRITDSIALLDGRTATIEQGRAYAQGWHYSGFSGTGYIVRINGADVPNGQVATRREALDLARQICLDECSERDPA